MDDYIHICTHEQIVKKGLIKTVQIFYFGMKNKYTYEIMQWNFYIKIQLI